MTGLILQRRVFAHMFVLLGAAAFSGPAQAQQFSIEGIGSRHRIIAVLPLTGAGTYNDPRRPAFLPLPEQLTKPGPDRQKGIVAYSFQFSDDGQFAIVQIAATDRNALKTFKETAPIQLLVEKSPGKKDEIESALRKYKKDYSLDSLQVVMP